jgi:outer membrane protein OmpA-like peptidoglycan-associated protein
MMVNDGGWCSFHLYQYHGDPSANMRRAYETREMVEAPVSGELRFRRSATETRVEYRPAAGFVGRDVFSFRLFPGGGIFRVTALVMPQQLPQREALDLMVYFDFDASILKPDAIAKIDEIAARLLANPRLRIGLEGHTDALGTDSYNDQLSARRVVAVRDYLVNTKGIAAGRVMMATFGKRRPVDPARPVADENRRVRVITLDTSGLARWSSR